MLSRAIRAGLLALVTLFAAACGRSDAAAPALNLPEGFRMEVLVEGLPNARSMALGEGGTLFVGSRRPGKVWAVRQPFSGNPEVVVLAEDLEMPNGVAVRDGDLYVALVDRVLVFRDVESRLASPGSPEVAVETLPFKNRLHSWKYIAFGPDGKLYVPVGAPCNVCEEPEFSGILRMNADGSGREWVARGVRNSVGFDWHPVTGELWFTDNGRDMLGDDIPPCELNRVSAPGQHFGFPFCHGGTVADPEFGETGSCAEAEPPVQALAPHSAPLAVRFYTGDLFPPEYRGQAFIAEHGSWNRSKDAGKTGYRISLVKLDGNRAVSYASFAEGFLDGDEVRGRPVDLLVAPDGALLVSDDHYGAIYRISYQK